MPKRLLVSILLRFKLQPLKRPCNRFWPEHIPGKVYSHINFAFATIDPQSFEVNPADARDVDLYTRVTSRKQLDPNLKVFIALGGWTFNDPGPTQTIFSDLAASEDKQKAFFKSLVSFMSTYDFDGIDLDWEYPEADDRNGRPEDFKNFSKFLANLRSTLDKTPGRNGISITLPASYWYLQHFDLQALAKSVSFFNIMSYDLHGTWDMGNKWTGEYLNAHTNLTEIDLALDLLWRNDIKKDMVVMGLAFYGRTYTVNPTCVEPGCMYLSGGVRGSCSREVGVLLNNEIDQIRDSKGVSPTLYKDAAVQVLHWDNQWVSYDNADTFVLKTNFARKRCLGGVMVWAISHDNTDGYYSKALGRVTGYLGSMQFEYDDGLVTDRTNHSQCHWTNCGEACPSGWALVPRTDEWKNTKDEYMFDDTACMGTGSRAWCCPPGKTPTCGWYSFKAGRCEDGCPSGMKEISSTSTGCRYDSHQTACCTLTDSDGEVVDGMTLYGACEWDDSLECEKGVCSTAMNHILGKSPTGSGENYCHDYTHREKVWPALQMGERKYCCDTDRMNRRWQNCEWVSNVGTITKDMQCVGFCPAGKFKVAMNTYNHGCYHRGYESYCCEPSYYTETTRYSDDVAAFQDALAKWGADPTCSTTDLASRDLETRDDSPVQQVRSFLQSFFLACSMAELDRLAGKVQVWDAYMIAHGLKYLVSNTLAGIIGLRSDSESFDDLSDGLACDPALWNAYLDDSEDVTVPCNFDLCTTDNFLCTEEGFDNEDLVSGHDELKRWFQWEGQRRALHRLEKRAQDKQVVFNCDDGIVDVRIRFWRHGYPSSGDWPTQDSIYDEALDNEDVEDCANCETNVKSIVVTESSDYHTEHIIELQSMPKFFAWLVTQASCNVDCQFFLNFFNKDVLKGTTPMPGGFDSGVPSLRIMEALGSWTNQNQFRLLEKRLNGMKAVLWALHNPSDPDKWKDIVKDSSPNQGITILKRVVTVFSYLKHPEVWKRLKATNGLIRQELKTVQDAYNQATGSNAVIVDCWDRWLADHLAKVLQHGINWATQGLTDMENQWLPKKTTKLGATVIRVIRQLRRSMGKQMNLDLNDLV
ncbi:hypothetical protein ATERTT37_003124 [Aspergillus terreus]